MTATRRMAPFALVLGLVAAACSTSTNSTPHSSPSAPTAGTGGKSGAPPAFAAELEPLIAQKLKDNAIPGAVVLIDKGGQGRWLQTFGTAGVGADVPLKPNDYFRVGSNTKTMTATIILQLVQEGRLALDDPVAKYYPGIPNGDTITIAELLDMRSGLPNYTYDPAFVQQPQKAWTPEELLALSFAKPVNFAPGARVRVLQHELHRARSHPRKAHRHVSTGGVPAAHLRAARADPHVPPRPQRQHDPRSASERLHVPHRQRDARHDPADTGPTGRRLRRAR